MRQKHTFTVIFIIFLAAALHGAELPSGVQKESYTIEELVGRSLANYELLKASGTAVEQYRHRKNQAGAWQNPWVELNGGMKTGSSATGYLYGLSLNQTIPYPGKLRNSRDIVGHDETLARIEHEEMRLYVSYEVYRLAWRYRAVKEIILHSGERLRRFKLVETSLNSRPVLSPEKIVEKNIIQARVRMLEKDMIEMRLKMREAFNELNLFTCLSVDEDRFPEITGDWPEAAPALDTALIKEMSMKNNYAILLQREIVARSRTLVSYEEKKANPDIGLNLFYGEEKLSERERSIGAGVSLPIPVLDRNSEGIKAGRLNGEAEQQRLLYTERNLARTLSFLFAEYETASGLMQKFNMKDRDAIAKTMRFADNEFLRGMVSLQTYLEMDTQSHDLLGTMYEAQLRMIDAYTGILYHAAIDRKGRVFDNDK